MKNSNAILEINTKNLLYNYQLLSKIAKKSIAAATIKANAYGLGDKEVFKILHKAGCNHFFLATTEEGIRIRKFNKKTNLYILNGLENCKLKIFYKYNLTPILISIDEVNILSKNRYFKSKLKFGIHVDTGLNRLGINMENLKNKVFDNMNIEVLLSHLASPDELKNQYTKIQNINFNRSFNFFKEIKYKSLCSSAGVLNNKNLHHDMIRPGISMYGGYDQNINILKKFKIKPVIILKGKILQIKEINKNEFVGYNQTFKTNKKIKVAIVGIGYADGISRLLSNNGYLYFKKEKYRILGRISMDSITVDITNKKYTLKIGQYLDIINKEFTIQKMAQKCGTISNEILTSISKRVKRVYI